MDLIKPLPCTVEAPQYLSIGDSPFQSGCAVMEVHFPSKGAVDIGKICMVNNYTAHLSLKAQFKKKSSSGQTKIFWKTCVRRLMLMPNPHCENGSQGYFTLWPKDFCTKLSSVSALRFILSQPSPNWKTFTLEEIYIYPNATDDLLFSPLSKRLLQSSDETRHNATSKELKPSDQAQLAGLPDPSELSSLFQQVLFLTQKAEECQPNSELGRFDVDGCYEINLLSYT